MPVKSFVFALLGWLISMSAMADDLVDAALKVQNYVNGLETLQAEFTQVGPEGTVSTGTLYLKRPGKMRWEYDAPTPIIMISNGDTLIHYDKELDQVSYLSLEDSLAQLLTQPDLDFRDEALRVVNVAEGAGRIKLTLLQTNKPEEGALSLVMQTQPLRLKQLFIADANNQVTQITLEKVQTDKALKESLFEFRRTAPQPYRR